MYFTESILLELVIYVVLLFVLFAVVRYLATVLSKIFRRELDDLKTPVDQFINNVYYPVSYWTERGCRDYQEDRHVCLQGLGREDSSLYAVFDGHAGVRAAQYCKENLLRHVKADPSFVQTPAKALENAFLRTDSDFSAVARIRKYPDGSTAIVASVHDRRIYVANAGDSRCILVQKGGKVVPMSFDHKPNREDEERRITALGGQVIHWGRWRVQGVLAVSRSIGDVMLQPYITCMPEIVERSIEPMDEYLVIASDGIWDVISNEEAGRLVWKLCQRDFLNAAKLLCGECLLLGSTDNVTAVIVDLRRDQRTSSSSSSSSSVTVSPR